MPKKINQAAPYFWTMVLATLFLVMGNRLVRGPGLIDDYAFTYPVVRAQVVELLYEEEDWFRGPVLGFAARVTRNNDEIPAARNQTVYATQMIQGPRGADRNPVQPGDRVLLGFIHGEWHYIEHVRLNALLVLGAVFVLLLFVFAGFKGLSAVVALGLTCAAIFFLFVPATLAGRNIYVSAVVVCAFAIMTTLFLLNGYNKKSFSAVAGCLGGIAGAVGLTFAMTRWMAFTPNVDGHIIFLTTLPTANPIGLRAIIFAGILIGAVGAVMDVAVSISSALCELKAQAPDLSFRKLYRSGISIGRDIVGSMTNTLVLAYIGSSLTVLLVMHVHANSFAEMINDELVIVEILQAIIGSMGILLTLPLTALVCAGLLAMEEPEEPCIPTDFEV